MFPSCGLPCVILVPTFIPIYCLSLCIFLLKYSLQKYPGKKITCTPLKSKSFVPCIKKVRRRNEVMRGLRDSLTCISTFFSYLPKIYGIILLCYHFYFGSHGFFVCLFVFKMALNFKHHCQAFCLLLAFEKAEKTLLFVPGSFWFTELRTALSESRYKNVESDLFPCVGFFLLVVFYYYFFILSLEA